MCAGEQRVVSMVTGAPSYSHWLPTPNLHLYTLHTDLAGRLIFVHAENRPLAPAAKLSLSLFRALPLPRHRTRVTNSCFPDFHVYAQSTYFSSARVFRRLSRESLSRTRASTYFSASYFHFSSSPFPAHPSILFHGHVIFYVHTNLHIVAVDGRLFAYHFLTHFFLALVPPTVLSPHENQYIFVGFQQLGDKVRLRGRIFSRYVINAFLGC